MRLPLFPILAVSILLALSAARATPTENLGIRVLPAPGKVVVDGKADDWDLSGGIFACDDVEVQREKMGVWLYAMYDAQNLYLLAHFLDETPMNNPGQTIADYGFNGDSLQVRTITAEGTPQERGQHFTAWHGSDGADVIKVEQGKDFKEGVIADAKKTDSAQQAFAKDADGKGYIQEIAIPWKLLTRDGQPLAGGASFRMTIEPNFTIGTKGRFSIKDLFKPGVTPDRVFTFMSTPCWGVATLATAGPVNPQPVRLADAREFPVTLDHGIPRVNWDGLSKAAAAAGFKPVEFEMPFDGYISLNIKGPDGEVARQLLNSAFYAKGRHTVEWDGLANWSWTRPGEPLSAGDYTWSAIAHKGLGLRLRGWAANGGKAPWDGADGRGNWGGDHGMPSAVATDDQRVFLGWNGAEAGKSVVAGDLDGQVLWSNNRGGISGVRGLAADAGVVYVLGGNSGPDAEGANLYKLKAADGSYLKWEGPDNADLKIKSLWPADALAKPEKADAVRIKDGEVYLTFRRDQFIAVVNSRDGKLVKTVPETTTAKPQPSTVGKDGAIYAWTGEPDNQITVSKNGTVVQAIGRKGGRALLGRWQGDGLRFVSDLAIDAAGKLWVVETDAIPKRVSVWDPTSGKLQREFFGSTSYGALGGAIDPLDPNVMVGQGCEWRIDPQTGHAVCQGVITRDGMENSRFGVGSNGRLYLAVASKWAFESGLVKIFERLGDANYKLRCTFRYEGKDRTGKTILWTDANGDEQEQPDEITTVDGQERFSAWFMSFGPDLTITAGNHQFKPVGFTACGAPKYDLAAPLKLPAAGFASADARLVLEPGRYGETHTLFQCFDVASGRRLWSYPDNFNGVHGSHNACPPAVGMIRGSYGPCGSVRLPAPLGNVWVIPTNVGEWHLLNEDGYYVGKLFEGDPLKVQWPAEAVPGADLSHCPPGSGGEDFGGSIALGADGKLYLEAGKTAFWNLEVTGLETVTTLPGGALKLDAADTQQALKLRETQLQAAAGAKRMAIKKATVNFTGDFNADFKAAEIISFKKQEEAAVRAAALWDETTLYLAWDVRDPTPWINGAEEAESMYLGGDTVDFQLGVDAKANPKRDEPVLGDLRLSIGNFHGTPTAVLYRPVAAEKAPRTFSSGVVKAYVMDSVQALTGANLKVVKRGDRYIVEAAIPLTAIGLAPGAKSLRGDFGVTYGDPAGHRTRLRNYWSNQQTGLVDDAVFEVMLEPKNWGELSFQ
jgi:hypothetical protein